MDLELVAELVCPSRSTEARTRQIRFEQLCYEVLLVGWEVVRVDRGDYGQTGEATASDELHLHVHSPHFHFLHPDCLHVHCVSQIAPRSGRRETVPLVVSGLRP